MNTDERKRTRRGMGGTQRGVSLPVAIFVITVMAALATAINMLVAGNAESFQEEVQLTRALYAAESGAGFAMQALFPPAGYPEYATLSCGSATYEFAAEALQSCSASVACSLYASVDGSDYYSITSTGTCGRSPARGAGGQPV